MFAIIQSRHDGHPSEGQSDSFFQDELSNMNPEDWGGYKGLPFASAKRLIDRYPMEEVNQE